VLVLGLPKGTQINTDENKILLPFKEGGWEGLITLPLNRATTDKGEESSTTPPPLLWKEGSLLVIRGSPYAKLSRLRGRKAKKIP